MKRHNIITILIFTIVFFISCSKTLVKEPKKIKKPEYLLELQANKSQFDSAHSETISPTKITMSNVRLKRCLASLMNKDSLLVRFDNAEKENILISVSYENLRGSSSIAQSKQDVIKELITYLDITLKNEKSNKYTYNLVVTDSLLLNKHLSIKNNNASQSQYSYESMSVVNATLPEIKNTINLSFGKRMYILAKDLDTAKRYTFSLKDVRWEEVNYYLKKQVGLGLHKIEEIEKSAIPIKVVFNQ